MERQGIPQSLEIEQELHEQLKEAIASGGKTGDAAKDVAELLHPHFEKEEEYAILLLDF
jgi:bacterioferritin (cytochrome b1)